MSLPTAASVVSSGLNHYPSVYYDRVAVETLRSNLFMYPACDLRNCPDNSGSSIQLYGYTKMSANTTAATEGTPGSGQTLSDGTRTISLSNYVDYVSFSNKVVVTDFSDTIANGASELTYRGALSVDTVISTAVDTEANSDSATRIEIGDGSYMTAAKARQAQMSLRSVDVKPKSNGLFMGIIHSLMAFDLVNDNSAGGTLDLMKYSDATAPKNPALVGIQGSRIGNIGGVEWFESNAVPTEANWQSSSHTAYHAYVFGKDAFLASSLGKTDLNQKNFKVQVKKFEPGTNSLDPAGLIAAAASYNFFFGVVKRTGSVNGFRRIRSESSIG